MKKVRSYKDFIQEIKGKLQKRRCCKFTKYGTIKEKGVSYPLYKIQSEKIAKKDKILVITTGFHGEEPQGPITIQNHEERILNYANEKGVKIIIYPCINPSGFEYNKRYNLSDKSPNNYFIYYKIKPKIFASEIPYRTKFEKYIEMDKTKLRKQMPKESLLLIKDLKKSLINKKPIAILDMHQDDETPKNTHYMIIAGEKRKEYQKIMQKAGKYVRILKNISLSQSSTTIYGIKSPKELQKKIQKAYQLDEKGIITIHDGTITDFLYRKGAKHAVAIETDIKMSPKTAQKINLLWIKEMIDFISRER